MYYIFDCFCRAVATFPTVTHVDLYPITGFGKLFCGLIAFSGIGIVALPTGIISSGFFEKIENKKNEVKKCENPGDYYLLEQEVNLMQKIKLNSCFLN